ncbi:MAG: NAD(P)-dependent oxidoreductase, partial [Halochromatium sp.]
MLARSQARAECAEASDASERLSITTVSPREAFSTMEHLPIFLDIKAKPCLVVGGGPIALRKLENLKRAGAEISVVAP